MKKSITLLTVAAVAAASLYSCTGSQHVVDKSRVVANPMDLNLPFESRPNYDYSTLSSSMTMEGLAALAFADGAAEPDFSKAYPSDAEVEAGRTYNVQQLILQGFSGKPATKITGARTAADPVALYHDGIYFLFHSGAEGYWVSDDMQHWNHIDANFPAGVAPSVMVYGGEMYYVTSRINQIYKTATPLDGMSWQPIDAPMEPYLGNPEGTAHDPYFFADEDGKVYFYWESDYIMPIKVDEYDPSNHFLPKSEPVPVIEHHWNELGYEVPGDRNELYYLGGYYEGAIMTKYDGKYYLQYATNGTEYDGYADGVYISDSPTGPFTVMPTSPVSIREGGFTTSAGHGDTFRDEWGNWWHLSTNIIGQREIFERRISLYPVIFTPKGNMYALTAFGDYPFELPKRKVDFSKEDIHTGWMNLSLGKSVTVSSEQPGFEGGCAADNTIKTWWAAASGEPGEWIKMDLGDICTVKAVQCNFADHNSGYREDDHAPYQYTVEASSDGLHWEVIADKTSGNDCRPHELLVLEKEVAARYVRVINAGSLTGDFSMYDLRIFGNGNGKAPSQTVISSLERKPENRRRITVSWEENPEASGYLLRWGADKDELYTSMEIYDGTSIDLGCFIASQGYYFTIDSFNDNGITKGKDIFYIE